MEALILDTTGSAAARALSLALPVRSWLQLGRQMAQTLGTCRGGGPCATCGLWCQEDGGVKNVGASLGSPPASEPVAIPGAAAAARPLFFWAS